MCDAAIALNLAAHTALAVYNGMGVGLDNTFFAVLKYTNGILFGAAGFLILRLSNVDIFSIFVKQ